jgi:uncharacterized protein
LKNCKFINGSQAGKPMGQNGNCGIAMRRCVNIVIGVTMLFVLSGCLIDEMGGAFTHEPEEFSVKASQGAKALVAKAFEGIEAQRLVDYHTHIVGLGTGNNGTFVNPEMRSWRHPVKHFKFNIYLSASGIRNVANADAEYVGRLVRLIRSMERHGKYRILAFDRYYNPDGTMNPGKTEFYVPNEYVFKLCQDYPDLFLPVISVNPYRKDALLELRKWAEKGVRYIKWLPNAMGINPADPRIDPFYAEMKSHDMILLTHTGEEQAVEAEADQQWGNPQLLRKPLSHGIRVIMSHCASLGDCVDLDSPKREKRSCFSLFLRMMDEKQYEGLLFGEISAQFQFNRLSVPISTILKRHEMHHRLVNGSDYPMPGVNVLLRTRDLVQDGFISSEERSLLNEIYGYNPLLFDFVLKRTVHLPNSDQKLSNCIFTPNPKLQD